MGRKRKVARPQDCESRALLPPCRVCEGPAGGFHYGVNSCEACKGFFHRCISGKEQLKCNVDGKCPVLYTMSKVCKMCRYNKCIAVGMAKHAIKTGRYTAEKRTKDILEIKKLERKKSRSAKSPEKFVSRKTNSALNDCLERIQQTERSYQPEHHSQDSKLEHPEFHGHPNTNSWRQSQYDWSNDKNMTCSPIGTCSFSPLSEVSDSSPSTSETSSISSPLFPPSSSSASSHMGNAHSHPCNSSCDRTLPQCQCSQDILELYSDIDRVIEILLKAKKDYVDGILPSKTEEEVKRKAEEHMETCRAREEMFGRMLLLSEQEYDHIFATTGLDADGRRQNMAIFSTRMELYIRACAKFAKKIPGFAYLDIQDQVTLIKYSLDEFKFFMGFQQVHRGVVQYSDLKLRCKRCYGNKVFEEQADRYIIYCETITRMKCTVEEKVIMAAIALMAPDREHYVKSEKVNRIYELLNGCLIKLFSRRSARPLQMYAKIMNIMVGYRSFSFEIAKFLKSLRFDKYSNALDNPLLREVFGGTFSHDFESKQTEKSDPDISTPETS